MYEDNYIMWLSRINKINSEKADRLIEYFGSAEEIYKTDRKELLAVVDSAEAADIASAASDGSLERYIRELEIGEATFISKYNERFPEGLKTIDDVPLGIYCKGRLPGRYSRCVSMVGSRRCSEYGKHVALKIAGDLAEKGVVIVSGMAQGVDSYSHEGALRHDGITVAVFGTAINKCYPAHNRGLLEKILENNGCVISEYAPDEVTYGSDFVKRNRIIAGMSEALVVVEAEVKSGTSSTVEAADASGRAVFAVPGSIFSKNSEGTNRLIRDGCIPVLEAEDILIYLGINCTVPNKDKKEDMSDKLMGVSDEGKIIIEQLGYEPMDFETLALKTGMQESKLRSELTLLEIKRLVTKLPGQRYILVL